VARLRSEPNLQDDSTPIGPRFDGGMPEPTGQKITFAEMRAAGVRGLLIYCSDYRCSHWKAISGDRWPDSVRLSDLEPLFVCQVCGDCAARSLPRLTRSRRPSCAAPPATPRARRSACSRQRRSKRRRSAAMAVECCRMGAIGLPQLGKSNQLPAASGAVERSHFPSSTKSS
jgi:hypothetical protein